jgi:hypothetical protein
MTVRRLTSVLVVVVAGLATVVAAQPKKAPAPKTPAPKKPPTPKGTPAKDAGSGSATAPAPAGSGSGSAAGSAVTMPEDPPPKDMEGKEENPDAPKGTGDPDVPKVVAPVKQLKSGYPIQESLRPINLPANMSEVAIGPHAQFSPYAGTDALRARYGITRQVQLGLTYLLGSVFNDHDVDPAASDKQSFHTGKAVGLDVTVLLQDWIGVRVGVPVYINPSSPSGMDAKKSVAVSLTIGAPLKFQLGEKFAVGGLDDLLSIRLYGFPPSFYQEADNARGAFLDTTNSTQSKGQLRFTGFGVYNYMPKTAFIGRLGIVFDNFSQTKTNAGQGIIYLLRAGVNYTPRKYLDLGISLGFDDLAHYGSFGPAGFLAFRI